MKLRPYIIAYLDAQENSAALRKGYIIWLERAILSLGWVAGYVLNVGWLAIVVGVLGMFSLVQAAKCAWELMHKEAEEYEAWSKIDQVSLFGKVYPISVGEDVKVQDDRQIEQFKTTFMISEES